jgi:hypothetical protein
MLWDVQGQTHLITTAIFYNEFTRFYNGQNLGEFYYAFYAVIWHYWYYTVKHPEDGHRSDRNM